MRRSPQRRSLFRRFLRQGEGATAVEFALVAPAFIALLYAILQTALLFFAQQALQTATLQAARQIMTGQAQSQSMTQSQFQQVVCANAGGLFNCGGIFAAVQTFTSFPNVTMFNPVSNGKFTSSNMPYNPGVSGDVVVVQVFYQWPVYPGPLNFTLANASGNVNVLVATAAFRNEP